MKTFFKIEINLYLKFHKKIRFSLSKNIHKLQKNQENLNLLLHLKAEMASAEKCLSKDNSSVKFLSLKLKRFQLLNSLPTK